jgi:hypothetical protein
MAHADRTEGSLFTYLRMGITYGDASSLTFAITTSSIMKKLGGAGGRIQVTAHDGEQLPHDSYQYSMSNTSSSVKRIDLGDQTQNRLENKPPIVIHEGEVLPGMTLSEEALNFRLEEQMRLNNQPVSPAEIEHLCTLLRAAWPI